MVRIQKRENPFGDGVELDRLARAHREVVKLKRARDRAVLRHAEDLVEARRAEIIGDRRIADALWSHDLTPERYERIMECVRSDPVLEGILLEAVRELFGDGHGEAGAGPGDGA